MYGVFSSSFHCLIFSLVVLFHVFSLELAAADRPIVGFGNPFELFVPLFFPCLKSDTPASWWFDRKRVPPDSPVKDGPPSLCPPPAFFWAFPSFHPDFVWVMVYGSVRRAWAFFLEL